MQDDIDQAILAAANMKGLEVIVAKSRCDLKKSGVHIINPDYDHIMEAICKALALELEYVVCYTKPLN